MWEKLLARMSASIRFRKSSIADLNWQKYAWMTIGVGWILIGVLGWSGWPAVLAVLLGIGWLVQSGLAVREIRRRRRAGSPQEPLA